MVDVEYIQKKHENESAAVGQLEDWIRSCGRLLAFQRLGRRILLGTKEPACDCSRILAPI
jgi:hypothetical protein